MPDPVQVAPIPSVDDPIALYDAYLQTQQGGKAAPVEAPTGSAWIDVPKQAAIGATLGLANTFDAPFAAMRDIFGDKESFTPYLDENGNLGIQKPGEFSKSFDQPETLLGGLARGTAQFTVGAATVGGTVGASKSLAMSLAKGAAADFISFGSHEERLSNTLASLDVPVISTVADYLKADDNDGQLQGRLKNVLEGGIIGVAADGAGKLIGGIFKLRRAKAIESTDPAKATELVAEATKDLGEVKPPSAVLAPAKPIQATAKDRIVAKTLEIDPSLSHDEASALADIQISLAKYVNPAAEADITLAGIMDVKKISLADKALEPVVKRIVDADPAKSIDEAWSIARAQAVAVKPADALGNVRGQTTFANNGKALVELFDNSDLSTHLHETAHVFRRFLRPEDKAVFEKWLGVTDKGWKRGHEERFAKGFEEYMRQGVAPNEELKGAFARIKAVVVDIYTKLRGNGKGLARLNPEVKAAYDRMLTAIEKEGIYDTRVNMAAKQLSMETGLTIRPTHVRALDAAVKNGGRIGPDMLQIPHFTRILQAAHESQQTADIAHKVFSDVNDLHPTGVETLVDTARLAHSVGQDQTKLVDTMRSFVKDSKQLPALLAAYDWHVQTLTARLGQLAEKIRDIKEGEVPEKLVAEMMQRHSELTDLVTLQVHGQTLVGRSMGAYRLRGSPIDAVAKLFADGNKDVDQLFQSGGKTVVSDLVGGQKAVKELAEKIIATKGKADAAKAIEEAGKTWHSKVNKTMEWYMNAILSGPKTHLVNLVSNTTMSVMVPLERAIGGKFLSAFGNKAAAEESKKGMAQLMGLRVALSEALTASKDSWSTGKGFMELASSADNMRGTNNKFLKKYVYVASRALQTEDTFFKVLAFRAHAYAELMGKAGKEANPQAFLKAEIDKMQANPMEYMASVNAAKTSTFTHDLKQGSVAKWVSDGVNQHPMLRLVVPFVKTPSNILMEFGRHIPGVVLFRRSLREAVTGKLGAEAQASYVGKQIVGFGLTLGVIGLYNAGSITAAGPRDPQEKQAWLAAGNREYSIRVGNTWYEYKRMDPWATLLGTMASTVEATTKLKDPMEAGSIIWKGVVQGFTDKTYFKGISDLSKAIDSPERFFPNYAGNISSGMLPYSGALSQATRAMTGASYRIQGYLDTFEAKSLGLFEPEKRFDLYGNRVNPGLDDALSPLAATELSDSPALTELTRIKGGLNMDPPKMLGNVKLSKEQREYIAEQTGKVQISGQTLMQRLEGVVSSESYKRLPPLEDTPQDYMRVPRALALKRTFDQSQNAAIRLAKERFPELKNAVKQDQLNKVYAKSGDFERIQEIMGR